MSEVFKFEEEDDESVLRGIRVTLSFSRRPHDAPFFSAPMPLSSHEHGVWRVEEAMARFFTFSRIMIGLFKGKM